MTCEVTRPCLCHPPCGAGPGITAHTLQRDLGTVTIPEQSSPGANSSVRWGLPLSRPRRGVQSHRPGSGGVPGWRCAGRAVLPHTCLARGREQSPRGTCLCLTPWSPWCSGGGWIPRETPGPLRVLLPAESPRSSPRLLAFGCLLAWVRPVPSQGTVALTQTLGECSSLCYCHGGLGTPPE